MARKSSGSRSSSFGAFGFTLIALVLTGCTAFFLARVLKGKNIDVTPKKSVVVAARDIKASVKLKRDFFKVVKLPLGAIPKNHYSSIDEIFPAKSKKPKVLVINLYKNEILSSSRVSNPKQGTGFASLVDQNYRALSLEVDSRTTRANVVYPGAYVDVLATMRRSDSRDSITRLVVQGVKVLAVNGISDSTELEDRMRKNKKKRSRTDVLTILVDPDQGEALTLASNEGKINVLLRNSNDFGSIDTHGVTSKEITSTGDEEKDEAKKQKSKGRSRASRNRFRRSSRRKGAGTSSRPRRSSTTTIDFSQ